MTKVHIPDGADEVPGAVASVTAELQQTLLPQTITGKGKLKLKDLRQHRLHGIGEIMKTITGEPVKGDKKT